MPFDLNMYFLYDPNDVGYFYLSDKRYSIKDVFNQHVRDKMIFLCLGNELKKALKFERIYGYAI